MPYPLCIKNILTAEPRSNVRDIQKARTKEDAFHKSLKWLSEHGLDDVLREQVYEEPAVQVESKQGLPQDLGTKDKTGQACP